MEEDDDDEREETTVKREAEGVKVKHQGGEQETGDAGMSTATDRPMQQPSQYKRSQSLTTHPIERGDVMTAQADEAEQYGWGEAAVLSPE
jgi:hypothetical protein